MMKMISDRYVPNVAYEIQLRNELNLKGVIIGFLAADVILEHFLSGCNSCLLG